MKRLFSLAARGTGFFLVFAIAAGSLFVSSRARGRWPPARQDKEKEKEKEKQEPKDKEKKDEPKKKPPPLPLKSNRTIEFTTDEGTWVSLDVSPDGKTIVFDLLGDLYSVGIEGGDAKAITTGPAFDSSAAVFARREVDRIRQRPRRRRELVGRGQGRHGRPAAFQGQAVAVRLAVVDSRGRLRARLAAAAATVGGVRRLDVPHPRRVRHFDHQGEDQARRARR